MAISVSHCTLVRLLAVSLQIGSTNNEQQTPFSFWRCACTASEHLPYKMASTTTEARMTCHSCRIHTKNRGPKETGRKVPSN